jgi:hypothetical protein
MTFDYELPAELFTTKPKGGARSRLGYRRFATAAEAIRFVVEDFPALRTLGAWMQVGDARYDSEEIRRLYQSGDYPLRRRTCRGMTLHSQTQGPELTEQGPTPGVSSAPIRFALGSGRQRILDFQPIIYAARAVG